ncbi:MAG: aspartate--tRNA ligase [Candidatus Nealsonbacteria bacterium]
MIRIYNNQTIKYINKEVKISGWIDSIRSHGKIIFIDIRDKSGVLQLVAIPKNEKIYKIAKEIRPEWVISVQGKVGKRPKKMENSKIETGKIEVLIEKLDVLSESETLPFSIETNGYEIDEEKRMKYRYLDLRRNRLRNNIINRQKVIHFMRNYFIDQDFIEVETPILTKSTPEGARDFVVPSRLQKGKFYALPQSPQQYKQLLQVAGIEKYFQIARCLRDEDPRGDRQAEHTQLDIEMSFIEEKEILNLIEKLYIKIIKELFPEKKIIKIPFPRITYKEAIKRYKTDRPDLRKNKKNNNDLAFCWVVDFPFFEKNKENKWTFTHNPFSAPKQRFMKDLLDKKNIGNILTSQYDIVLNGMEVGGGSIRNHLAKALLSVFEIIGYKNKEVEDNFGHMLEAFKYGAPPHGGIACGIDRFLSILFDEPNIREVIAFPKTGDSRDLMMNSPSEISSKQLKELNIRINLDQGITK